MKPPKVQYPWRMVIFPDQAHMLIYVIGAETRLPLEFPILKGLTKWEDFIKIWNKSIDPLVVNQ